MYGNKVFTVGLAVLLALPVLVGDVAGLPVAPLGALITIVGAILVVLDK